MVALGNTTLRWRRLVWVMLLLVSLPYQALGLDDKAVQEDRSLICGVSYDTTSVDIVWLHVFPPTSNQRYEIRTLDGVYREIESTGIIPILPQAHFEGLTPETVYFVRVKYLPEGEPAFYSNELPLSTDTVPGTCQPNPYSLCLHKGRFRIQALWETEQGSQGRANAVPLTSESGFFWFFNQDNPEVIVKILDGSAINGDFWLFAAGLTDQQVIWTVTETTTGKVKTFYNPLKTRFKPFLEIDYRFLRSCPP